MVAAPVAAPVVAPVAAPVVAPVATPVVKPEVAPEVEPVVRPAQAAPKIAFGDLEVLRQALKQPSRKAASKRRQRARRAEVQPSIFGDSAQLSLFELL